jgi:hypothetical protein
MVLLRGNMPNAPKTDHHASVRNFLNHVRRPNGATDELVEYVVDAGRQERRMPSLVIIYNADRARSITTDFATYSDILQEDFHAAMAARDDQALARQSRRAQNLERSLRSTTSANTQDAGRAALGGLASGLAAALSIARTPSR